MPAPRTILRRLLASSSGRPVKPSSSVRLFTRHSRLGFNGRPQLPYLAVPLARNQQFRYLTTERKRWLAHELVLGIKYTVTIWAIIGFGIISYLAVYQETLEREYPTPHEWSIWSRFRFRLARWFPNRTDVIKPDWVSTALVARYVLERLEDPKIDGAGLEWVSVGEGEDSVTFANIMNKSEEWRRGYHDALMLCAKAAEHVDHMVEDMTRAIVFPRDVVIGPSNPYPKPIPHGSKSAPREENCERVFEIPEVYYNKILSTVGFTTRQKVDALMGYAAWCEYKGDSEGAEQQYQNAVNEAITGYKKGAVDLPSPLDRDSTLRDGIDPPSACLLDALTARATHQARTGNIPKALPTLISVLRARRSLPMASEADTVGRGSYRAPSGWTPERIFSTLKWLVLEPPYPAAPPSGDEPPVRDAQELCREAELNLHIGEIIFAGKDVGSSSSSWFSSSSVSSTHEDGLAWTREAVDLAEEELHKLGKESEAGKEARTTCRACLNNGLDNWAKMAALLAREEEKRRGGGLVSASGSAPAGSSSSSNGWLGGLLGDGKRGPAEGGRWAAEVKVVAERRRRAREVLEDAEKRGGSGLGTLLSV